MERVQQEIESLVAMSLRHPQMLHLSQSIVNTGADQLSELLTS